MRLTLVTPPSIEPVTVSEAKAHLRLDGSDEDVYLETLITVARLHVEDYTQRQLINATYSLVMDRFPACGAFEMPKAPLVSVSSITYTDTQGNAGTTWSSSNYVVDAPAGPFAVPGRVALANGVTYPSTHDEINVVTYTYVAGYGTAASDVPAPLRQAVLLLVAELYERREQVTFSAMSKNVLTAERLMSPYRVIRWR